MNLELNFWSDIPPVYSNKKHLIPKDYLEPAHILLRRLHGHSAIGRLDLITKSGIRKQTATYALNHLVRLGIVQRSGKGTKGKPFKYSFT